MKNWQILHITDLHIADPNAGNEYLRLAYYDEYFDLLAEKIKPKLNGDLDCIVVTGDFIDKGKVECFEHAQTVLNYLASIFGVSTDRVVVCNGNHDIVRDKEKAGELGKAREAYRTFAQAFGNRQSVKSIERAELIQPVEGLWCLMIDATRGSKGEDHPGNLDNSEADTLMQWIKNDVRREDTLIIGVHYPVHNLMGEESLFDEPEDPYWHTRHIWGRGAILKERIRKKAVRPQTIWLCGDIHKHSNVMHDRQCFIATGRIGTAVSHSESQVRRHARIIQISKDGMQRPRSLLLEFEPVGHSAQPHIGTWRYKYEDYHNARTLEESPEEPSTTTTEANIIPVSGTSAITPTSEPLNTLESATEVAAAKSVPSKNEPQQVVEVIDETLQSEVIKTIIISRLYHLGRFNTAQSEVSLSWVSIGPLLNEGTLLAPVISKMGEWLRNKIGLVKSEHLNKTLLLGIDCWGAVLASQLSILTGVSNFCIALRADGKHHLPTEVMNEEIIEEIKKCETVILVSDVVATGWSLRNLYDRVALNFAGATNIKWISLSLIYDPMQLRQADSSFINTHATVCSTLRMPLLSSDALPDETILPPIISFK